SSYQSVQEIKESIFIINSHRRFHKGFEMVNERIKEINLLTNCPITFLQAYHCDGQWRLPNEIVTQSYHPYCQGYGKASHSGYHIFDTVAQFLESSFNEEKKPDYMQISSSFVQPNGFFKQLNEDDYYQYFGSAYQD